ncbi:hypothetical protein GGE65_006211 [Skermanella aerolata]|uniref:hypothetical protein n=1 Tax=Skermanella aerolata TaxID=393310 RepID=UPI003D238197
MAFDLNPHPLEAGAGQWIAASGIMPGLSAVVNRLLYLVLKEHRMVDTKDVQCGFCHVTLEPSTDPVFENGFACPICGNGDEFDNILTAMGEYVEDRSANKFMGEFSDTLAGGGLFKITQKPVPKKVYRFIVDL